MTVVAFKVIIIIIESDDDNRDDVDNNINYNDEDNSNSRLIKWPSKFYIKFIYRRTITTTLDINACNPLPM